MPTRSRSTGAPVAVDVGAPPAAAPSPPPAVASRRSRVYTACPVCHDTFRTGFVRCPRDGATMLLADRDPLSWAVLDDRYLVGRRLAEGGVARVYRGRRLADGAPVAIKIPFGDAALVSSTMVRFDREARLGRRVRHRNVVGVLDDGATPGGLRYLVMELAGGPPLRAMIDRVHALPATWIVGMVGQIAEGLRHLHGRGLVHRDLKPGNVLIEARPGGGARVRIVDLGNAVAVGAGDGGGRATAAGQIFGTPEYVAPEQLHHGPIGPHTDLFTLGLVLWELLAGVRPFDGDALEVARHNAGAPWPRVRDRAPGRPVDPLLEALARWLLHREPERRPASAGEVVAILREIAHDRDRARARLAAWR
ncbi:MAG: serine/threonine protein kinase [Kofleriaceae bacterium]|nr:serine/threonine protein kinase [Kofleriaceae bacterium]